MANENGEVVIPGAEPGADKTIDSKLNDGTPADKGVEQKVVEPPKEKQYSFKEDRSDWVPRTRLNEVSGKTTKLEQELAVLRQQNELNEKRVRLALGIEVPSKEDAETQEIRQALLKVNPKLALLDRLDEETIEKLLNAGESANEATRAQWERHRVVMMTDLEDEASDLLGVDKLSEAQVKRLHREFRSEAQEHARVRARAEQTQDPTYDYNNDFVARYERGDKKLLQEFAKSFIDEWGIPARRSTIASAVSRQSRPVPRGERNRTHLTQGPPKIDYNDDKAFKEAMKSARLDGGSV